ncbi:hypothetical protein KSF81_00785 [Siccirubricoccus sp. G192]|nr:hypothetical protein [Siccirubricoccus sp. G192]
MKRHVWTHPDPQGQPRAECRRRRGRRYPPRGCAAVVSEPVYSCIPPRTYDRAGAPERPPDLAGCLLAEGLARRRGHPIAVENRAGADGVIGAEAFVQARPSEALFYSFVAAVTVAPLLHEGRLPFDPEADLVPISTGAADFFVVSVSPTLPVRTLAEFVEHARGQPGALNWFASPGAPCMVAALPQRAGRDSGGACRERPRPTGAARGQAQDEQLPAAAPRPAADYLR